MKYHFISGLPRSGSTLLAAILRQNPRFHASMTSPVGALVGANLEIMSAGSEVSLLMDEGQRPKILRGLFDAYYADVEAEVVFDTNRAWCARMRLVAEMFPGSKVVACVRDVPWIMDSLERLIQDQPFETTRLFGSGLAQASVYGRLDALARHDGLVGFPWSALKQAFYGDLAENLLVVDYDLLAQAPDKVVPLVYQFLGEPWYDGHDFDHVEYDAPDFDAALGVKGLHKVRPKVEYKARRTILPPDLFRKYADMSFWRDVTGSKANVIVAQHDQPEEAPAPLPAASAGE